jgi:sugar phosphate isomerase/epimerase
MDLGIFTKVFNRPTLPEVLTAVVEAGFSTVQFNLTCAGLPSMPDVIGDDEVEQIVKALNDFDIRVAALSGTFNMAHPEADVRHVGVRRLGVLASICEPIGCDLITICTGTRDPDDMWRAHPENGTPEAWEDMAASVRAALDAVRPYGVHLGFEPEPGNIIRTPEDGVRLIEAMDDPLLGVIFDPANILASSLDRDPEGVMDDAIRLLGDRVVLAHGKDLSADGEPCAAGRGLVPWRTVMDGLAGAGYEGALVLHGLTEDEVPGALEHLNSV